MPMTDVRETRTHSSHELTRMRETCSVSFNTDLQQDFSVASFSHPIDRALFHASFSSEFFWVRRAFLVSFS